jgi:hypothetical protein
MKTNCVGFEVLTAVIMKSTIFWDVMLYNPLKVNDFSANTSLPSSRPNKPSKIPA